MKKTAQIRARKHAEKLQKKHGRKRLRTSKADKYRYKFAPADDNKYAYGL